MASELVNGRWLHRWHQSDFKALNLCMERGRASLQPDRPRLESAAGGMGTAFHAAVEACIDSVMAGQGELDPRSMLAFAMEEFAAITKTEGFTWGKVLPGSVADVIARACLQFDGEVLPRLHPVATEVEFDGVTLVSTPERQIDLGGVIDLVDRDSLIDWKLIGRAYTPWEMRRWDIQSTVYAYAASRLGIVDGPSVDFNFCQFVKGKDVVWLPLERGEEHFAWLAEYATALAKAVESLDPAGPWPLNDNGWHCSPDWCEVWSSCKGKHFEGDNWK